ncbi:MAG: enoyl-CoA hydratase family protein [Acidobacteria bacterium]|nr:enoyl-CoA hydratase family protein [Acidobacteriota bacterium]
MPVNPQSFLYTFDATTGVATIVLNRPQRMNALTFQVYGELGEVFRDLADEPGVRAIVLTGQGKAFCTGGDVHDIIGALFERDADGLYEFTRMTCDVIEAMRACPQPIIAALNGTVAGAGAVLATAADLRVAAESARIAYLFTKVGLSGADMGMCWLLPRIVGFGRATELLMTGDFITAAEAETIGLYNRVVADENVLEVALNLAEQLAQGPAYGIGVTKRQLDEEADMTFVDALDREARVQADCMRSADFREAYDAFVEKREARFNTADGDPAVPPSDGASS